MTTAVDANILVSLWDSDAAQSGLAQQALDSALDAGSLVVCGPVYAELLAGPGRTEAFLDRFFRDSGVSVEWDVGENVWRLAGQAYQLYAGRRRRQRDAGPRRILTDFLIGAHAAENGHRLLTMDTTVFAPAFPGLRITTI